MSMIDSLKELFGKKGASSKEASSAPKDDKAKPIAADSFIDGDHGLIPGIKKIWVNRTIAIIAGIFVIAIFFAASPDDKTPNTNTNNPSLNFTKKATDLKQSKNAADQVAKASGDYEEAAAARAMKAKNDALAQQNGKAATSTNPKTATPAQPPQPSVPAAPQVDPNALAAMAREAAAEKARLASGIEMLKGNRNELSNGQSSAGGAYPAGSGVSSSSGQAKGINTISPAYTEATPDTIVSGTIFPVMLLTGINTDAPGRVLAQVQTNVYDFHHSRIIIPSGSKLLGSYEKSSATNGRLSLMFNALQLPDGRTYDIGESIMAIDGAGYMGVAGKTHRHTARKISGGVIGSAIAALGSIAAGNTSSNRESYPDGQLAAQGALGNLISATSTMINGDADNLKPTVTVEPGHQFNVYVVNNMVFDQ